MPPLPLRGASDGLETLLFQFVGGSWACGHVAVPGGRLCLFDDRDGHGWESAPIVVRLREAGILDALGATFPVSAITVFSPDLINGIPQA